MALTLLAPVKTVRTCHGRQFDRRPANTTQQRNGALNDRDGNWHNRQLERAHNGGGGAGASLVSGADPALDRCMGVRRLRGVVHADRHAPAPRPAHHGGDGPHQRGESWPGYFHQRPRSPLSCRGKRRQSRQRDDLRRQGRYSPAFQTRCGH